MKTAEQRKIEKLKEIIKDSFYQTGYSNGKLKYELSLIDKEIEEEKDVEETEQYCYKCSNYNNDDICKKCDDSFCMFKEIEQGEEKGLPKNSERDWTEDFPHENGMYQNRCMDCGLLFFGHKRRVWCKLCGGKPAKADSDKQKRAEDILDSREFYEVMQSYRHHPIKDIEGVSERYKDVKDWILGAMLEFSEQSVSDESDGHKYCIDTQQP